MLCSLSPISVAQSKQTLAVLVYLLVFLVLGPLSLTSLVYMLLYSQYWWVSVAYATWWLWDVQTCNTGNICTSSTVVTQVHYQEEGRVCWSPGSEVGTFGNCSEIISPSS